jgi:hypothetical protein
VIELRTRIFGLLFVALALPTAACGDDEEQPAAVIGTAQRGESCQAHYDCAPGLSCMGKRCSVSDFPLAPIRRECVSVECREPKDCCPTPPASCPTYKANCEAGITSYCTLHKTNCECLETDWSCENDLCVELCTTSSDCSTGGSCVNSKCADCASDDQCGTGSACVDQRCVPKCESNDECQYFHDCVAGTCVEVGCKTTRECQAAMSNVLSECVEGQCHTPCQSDIECDKPSDYGYSKCINGSCTDVGCESDEECRILLKVQAGRGVDAVCREPAAAP